MKWLVLIIGILSNTSASVLIKYAMQPSRKVFSLSDPIEIIKNWPLWLGLVMYGVAFVLYAYALKLFPLNVAVKKGLLMGIDKEHFAVVETE